MSIEKNKQAIREFTKVFKNEHNVNGVDHLFAKEFKHNFKVPVSPGLQGYKEIGSVMNTAFPDVAVAEDRLIADENFVVEMSHAVATNAGPYMQYPATNRKIKWTEIHVYKFNKDSKIIEHWIEMSMLELMMQIDAAKMV
ncbi:MAG: ester cyclase [Bacteroidetes bacterium]|nr:ester cyclase [Bacteroidota bacterium]